MNKKRLTKILKSPSLAHKCTFAAVYNTYESVPDDRKDAIYALGSASATFEATRGTSNPATYVDKDGVIQVTTTSNVPRFTNGYYDTTGFHTSRGVLIENASTNYAPNSYGLNTTDGDWDAWTFDEAYTRSVVDATSLINITGATAQRIQYTYAGDEGNWSKPMAYITANDTFDASSADLPITLSFWAKGDVSGITTDSNIIGFVAIRYLENDSNYVGETQFKLTTARQTLSASEWTRFTVSTVIATAEDGATRKLDIRFMMLGSSGNPGAGEHFDLQICGVQIEKQPSATSYIPTTSTTAITRNAEALSYANADNFSGGSAGTLLVQYNPLINGGEQSTYFNILNVAGASGNFYKIRTGNTGDDSIGFQVSADGGSYNHAAHYGSAGLTRYTRVNNTGIYEDGAAANQVLRLYADGAKVANDASDFTAPTLGTSFTVGEALPAIYSAVLMFNCALDDAEVALIYKRLNAL